VANGEFEGTDQVDLEQANGGVASASGNRKPTPQHHPRAGGDSSRGLIAERPLRSEGEYLPDEEELK
jgi:hypothetical protein